MAKQRWLSYVRSALPSVRSIDEQAKAIGQYVERDGGLAGEIVEFTDRGFSGLIRLEQRPGGGQLSEIMRRGDRLLVSSLDRLSRDPPELLRILSVLADVGVTLHVLEPRGQVCDIELGTLQMIRDGLEQLDINLNTDD